MRRCRFNSEVQLRLAEGAYTKHKLLEDPEVIQNVLEADVEPAALSD
jgi:hypothetical protein